MAAKGKGAQRKAARKSSIYRMTEHLLGDMLGISERIPKNSLGLQTIGGRMVNEAMDALVVIEFALNCQDIERRIAYIGSLIHSMTVLKSACRQLYGYSRREKCETGKDVQGEVTVKNVPCHGRIVSNEQYYSLLGTFNKLSREVGCWLTSSRMLLQSQRGFAK